MDDLTLMMLSTIKEYRDHLEYTADATHKSKWEDYLREKIEEVEYTIKLIENNKSCR